MYITVLLEIFPWNKGNTHTHTHTNHEEKKEPGDGISVKTKAQDTQCRQPSPFCGLPCITEGLLQTRVTQSFHHSQKDKALMKRLDSGLGVGLGVTIRGVSGAMDTWTRRCTPSVSTQHQLSRKRLPSPLKPSSAISGMHGNINKNTSGLWDFWDSHFTFKRFRPPHLKHGPHAR